MTARVRLMATRPGPAALNRRLIEAQERERTWLARELHDDIGQQIVLLCLDIELLREILRDSPADADARACAIYDQVVALGGDLHRLSHRLHSSKLEYVGLAVAARSLCAELSVQHRAEIAYAQEGVGHGLGLVSIQERLSLVHGEVIVESAVGHGTRIRARAPRQWMLGDLADVKSVAADRKTP